jgi:hypothetical protein
VSFTVQRQAIQYSEAPAIDPKIRRIFDTAAASQSERIQHPLQMPVILRSSSLSCSLAVARAAARRDLEAANRVRLIFTARCTGNVR